MTSVNIACLVLAAGQSQRFGSCKLLAKVQGKPLMQHMLGKVCSLKPTDTYLVTGAWHSQIQQAMENGELTDCKLIYNPDWSKGMGTSLALGVAHLHDKYDALLVVLADQIALHHTDLQRMCSYYSPNEVVSARYEGILGVPALFPKICYQQLMQLQEDKGARSLLQKGLWPVVELPMDNGAVDIDTPEQLHQWLNQ